MTMPELLYSLAKDYCNKYERMEKMNAWLDNASPEEYQKYFDDVKQCLDDVSVCYNRLIHYTDWRRNNGN